MLEMNSFAAVKTGDKLPCKTMAINYIFFVRIFHWLVELNQFVVRLI